MRGRVTCNRSTMKNNIRGSEDRGIGWEGEEDNYYMLKRKVRA